MNRLGKQWALGNYSKKGAVYWTNIIVHGSSLIVAKVCGKTKDESLSNALHICDLHNQSFI